MAQPSWRKIESVLIELLREEGLELGQYKGNTYVVLYDADGHASELEIGDFARRLEERL